MFSAISQQLKEVETCQFHHHKAYFLILSTVCAIIMFMNNIVVDIW